MSPNSRPEDENRGRELARVLYAEDDNLTSRMLASLLSDTAGIEVTRANDGQEALKKALAEPFELIIMDMEMPNLDGYEATRRLREAGINVPIVALTAHALDGDRRRCIAAGCTDYLSKPFSRQVLLQTLRTYLPSMEHYLGHKAESADPRREQGNEPAQPEGTDKDAVIGSEDGDSVVNLKQLLDRFGDAESVAELLPTYLDTAHQNMASLIQAAQAGLTEETARLAHAVRGAALNLGANRLASVALEVERAARSQDMATAVSLLPSVRSEYDRMRAFLARCDNPTDLLTQRDTN